MNSWWKQPADRGDYIAAAFFIVLAVFVVLMLKP